MTEPYIRWQDRRKLTPTGQLQTTHPLVEAAIERQTPFPGGDRYIIEGNPGGPPDVMAVEWVQFPPPQLKPGEIDLVRAMMVDGFSREEIVKTIRPPQPRPWRWWRDPLVIGAAIGVAIVLAFFFSVVP